MMYRRFARFLGIAVASVGPAIAPCIAQTIPGDPGPLPRPVPYFGTRTLGNKPVPYPDPRAPAPNPNLFWRNRILYNPGWNGGGTVVIINNAGAPCYLPSYYVSPEDYSGVRMAYRGQFGGFQLQYQQSTGYRGGYVNGSGAYTRQDREYVPVYVEPQAAPVRRPSTGDDGNAAVPAVEPSRASSATDGDYYLNARRRPSELERDPTLARAVSDIETAFRTGDIGPLTDHIDAKDTLTLQTQGRTRRRVAASEYLDMTAEALKVLKTARYTLNKVEPASNGAWMVTGTHVLHGEDGAEKTFDVGFVLKRRGDHWMIAEVTARAAR